MEFNEIILKVLVILIISGFIGIEREYNYRPAGFRTHTLVGIAATIITIIQLYIAQHNLELALANPDLSNIFVYEQSRLVAQIISGIGFLGAGTIFVTKNTVVGLTTAASLWATASLGIAVGFGYYGLAIIGFIAIYLVLIAFKRITTIYKTTILNIEYSDPNCKQEIQDLLKEKNIVIRNEKTEIIIDGDTINYKKKIILNARNNISANEIINLLSCINNIKRIQIIDE